MSVCVCDRERQREEWGEEWAQRLLGPGLRFPLWGMGPSRGGCREVGGRRVPGCAAESPDSRLWAGQGAVGCLVRQTETSLCVTACYNLRDDTGASQESGKDSGASGHGQMCLIHSWAMEGRGSTEKEVNQMQGWLGWFPWVGWCLCACMWVRV